MNKMTKMQISSHTTAKDDIQLEPTDLVPSAPNRRPADVSISLSPRLTPPVSPNWPWMLSFPPFNGLLPRLDLPNPYVRYHRRIRKQFEESLLAVDPNTSITWI